MDQLISNAASPASKRPELLKALISGQVVIIASWPSTQGKTLTIQDFVRDGRSFIPVFSTQERFKAETKGSGFEDKGVSIDGNLFASILKGSELLILNPGSPTPVQFHAQELKALVDPARLPK
jgi:hypothetical protein